MQETLKGSSLFTAKLLYSLYNKKYGKVQGKFALVFGNRETLTVLNHKHTKNCFGKSFSDWLVSSIRKPVPPSIVAM